MELCHRAIWAPVRWDVNTSVDDVILVDQAVKHEEWETPSWDTAVSSVNKLNRHRDMKWVCPRIPLYIHTLQELFTLVKWSSADSLYPDYLNDDVIKYVHSPDAEQWEWEPSVPLQVKREMETNLSSIEQEINETKVSNSFQNRKVEVKVTACSSTSTFTITRSD